MVRDESASPANFLCGSTLNATLLSVSLRLRAFLLPRSMLGMRAVNRVFYFRVVTLGQEVHRGGEHHES